MPDPGRPPPQPPETQRRTPAEAAALAPSPEGVATLTGGYAHFDSAQLVGPGELVHNPRGADTSGEVEAATSAEAQPSRQAVVVRVSQELTLADELDVASPREARPHRRQSWRHRGDSPQSIDSAELVKPGRVVRAPGQRALRQGSSYLDNGRLEGSSLRSPDAAAALRGANHASRVALRLRVIHRVPGRSSQTHQVEYRAHIAHNGVDVLRYVLYRDPDGCQGFGQEPEAPTYVITISERYVVEPNPAAGEPAEVHLRYAGAIRVPNGPQIRFRGTLIVLGTGGVIPGRPHLTGPAARASFVGGPVTVGLW